MKKYLYTPMLVMLLTAFMTVSAQNRQEYLGLPGDNLNLFAVMKLFQESETLESFERTLNDPESRINNLDLDGDGYVDYIKVIDNVDGNVHYIVMQIAVNARENQDVGVFTVIQQGSGQVQIQLVGDEALYGRNYIIEPIFDETPNPGYMGSRRVNGHKVNVVHTTYYEVASWPIVRVIYMPGYVVWHSPWYYNYYPVYWHSWNPFYWHYYYGYHYNNYSYYYGHYRHWDQYRDNHWNDSYYHGHRAHSTYVNSRINEGQYKSTYSRPELRREGTAMYYRTAQNNSISGGRRNASGGTSTGKSTTYGPRNSSNTNAGRQSGSGNRQSSSTVNRSSGGTTISNGRRSSGSVSSGESNVKSTNGRTSGGASRSTGGATVNTQRRSTTSGTNGNRASSGSAVQKSTTVRESSQRSTTTTTRETSGRRSASGASSNSEKKTESTNTGRGRR